MAIYTKNGDKGLTSLADGTQVSKSDIRIDACGVIDELNSHVGLLRSLLNEVDCSMLNRIQLSLFEIGAYISMNNTEHTCCIIKDDINDLEKAIDEIHQLLPPLHSFILPGGSVPASQSHICRTVCRHAERTIVAITQKDSNDSKDTIDPFILEYFNRLSDYFFVLARKLNFIEHIDEKTWKKTCR